MTTVPMPSGNGRDPYSLLGAEIDGLRREIEGLKTERTPILTSAQDDLNTSNAFPSSWSEVRAKLIDVPRGYSQAYVLLAVVNGQSVTGTGSATIGAWPVITAGGSTYSGPGISNGIVGGGAVSAPSFFAAAITGLAPGSQIRLASWSYSSGTVTPGSANAHLSAALWFIR